MPQAPLTYCAAQGCGAKVPSGYCAAHRTQVRKVANWDGYQRLYRTARWRRLRDQVRIEQPFCAEAGCHLVVDDVHHVVKRIDDLDLFFDRTNVVGLCRSHHSQRTQRGE
jgi:5-methylcytosine-specific restriction protein A